MALALVTVVASAAQVDGEDAAPPGCRSMNGAWPMELVSTARDGLKVQKTQYLFHRDLGAQAVEVDPWHELLQS